MAADFNSNRRTIRRILEEDLKMKCYRKVNVQKLDDYHQLHRKTCCTWTRKNFRREDIEKIMFTDEKIFNRCGHLNIKNDVVWAADRLEANKNKGIHAEEKYPATVMVVLGATWNGLSAPYFFEKNERLNGQMYYEKVLPFYQGEGNRLFGHRKWCLQQDGASAHTDIRSQEWCRNNLFSFIPKSRWPSNSLDLSPLDVSIWDRIDQNINYRKVNTREDLEKQIREASQKVDINYIRHVIGSFLRRVRAIKENNGGHIVHDYS